MKKLLEIVNLSISYGNRPTVKNVSLHLREGEIHCLVGGTGSGKSTVLHAIAGISSKAVTVTGGEILFDGAALLAKTESERRSLLGSRIALIFQNPEAYFDSLMTIGDQFTEFLQHIQPGLSKENCLKISTEALRKMRLDDPARLIRLYPFELSGGMLQRCSIAMAMLTKPKLLLADEPTSALDIVTQAKILGELKLLNQETGTAILMVTHNMKVAETLADTVSVMHNGEIVETGATDLVLHHPVHSYTKELIRSLPTMEEARLID
ncbi:MAG: ABC transporter ATP-binding protein [Acidaminococcaceae bacterium]|nr:ABC transporter ATP-binding protein [Acidaminococcaceae bacterium]MBQ9319560.1 ABC transporter ATP-binding protein [Acidaminococcaceae bacterium]MBR1590262.1 ABC transporter ATP-binding protein [Acidaminococcaceae bacterium]